MAWKPSDVLIAIHCEPTETNAEVFALANVVKREFGILPYILTNGIGVDVDGFEVVHLAGTYSESESPKISYAKALELARVFGRRYILFLDTTFPSGDIVRLAKYIKSEQGVEENRRIYFKQNEDKTEALTSPIFGCVFTMRILCPMIGSEHSLGRQLNDRVQLYKMTEICEELNYDAEEEGTA